MSTVSSGGGSNSMEFELNLAPIIDCFTVLIAFLLVSATYLSMSVFDAQVAPLQVQASPTDLVTPQTEEASLSVEIKDNMEIVVKVGGAQPNVVTLPRSVQGLNLAGLLDEIKKVSAQWPALKKMTLTAERSVKYREIVKTMEVSRTVVPGVMLGGF